MVITKTQKFWLESDFVLELLKQIPAYVFWKDRNSVYLGCNNAFAHSLGLSSSEEIVGKTDYDLPTTKEESNSFRADDKQVINSKKPKLNIEECQTLLDGRKVALLTNKVPLLDKQNNVIGILGIYYDISERKKREEELHEAKEKLEIASKIKTEFLENMRHDIRTPLSGIIGFAELIKSEVTDPKMKEYASNLTASGQALTDLLNEVLETIQVSSGEIPILKKKFSLQKRLNEVISLNQARALHKKIDLSLDYDPAIPDYLIGDSARIHRVILELVTNALNFTHKGYVKLSAQLAKNNEDDVVIKIVVDDTGIGIAPEKQQDIYLQFKRLTSSYEGIYKGHGLGLSIAKQFIDDLSGEIYVESQVGSGSKFIFIIKLKKALLDEEFGSEDLIPSFTGNKFIPPAAFKAFGQTIGETTESYKSRILVVEDSPMAAQVVTNMLSKMDCTVDLAEKGKVKNLAAYFMSAIKNNYQHPREPVTVIQQQENQKEAILKEAERIVTQINKKYMLHREKTLDQAIDALVPQQKTALLEQFHEIASESIETVLRLQRNKYTRATILQSPQIKALFRQFALQRIPDLKTQVISVDNFVKDMPDKQKKAWEQFRLSQVRECFQEE